jgi:hypothetical protein
MPEAALNATGPAVTAAADDVKNAIFYTQQLLSTMCCHLISFVEVSCALPVHVCAVAVGLHMLRKGMRVQVTGCCWYWWKCHC